MDWNRSVNDALSAMNYSECFKMVYGNQINAVYDSYGSMMTNYTNPKNFSITANIPMNMINATAHE